MIERVYPSLALTGPLRSRFKRCMNKDKPELPLGYSVLPQGCIATVVTCLEMLAKPAPRPVPAPPDLTIERWHRPDIQDYLRLYRRIGEEWLWMSRLVMDAEALGTILEDPDVEIYCLKRGNDRLALLELDFRESGECELAFFGVDPAAVGTGAGRFLMNAALDFAWSRPIQRFWVHTCHLDHPAALTFYQRSGFAVYDRLVEVFRDPRLDGTLRRDAGRHMPLIER